MPRRQEGRPAVHAVAPKPALTADQLERINLATGGRDPQLYKRFDRLREKGLTTEFPPSIDTILGDYYGTRSWLDAHNVNVEAYSTPQMTYNLLNNSKNLPIAFNGQRPTLLAGGSVIKIDFGLADYGLPDSYINVGALFPINSEPLIDGRSIDPLIRSLYYGQTFLDGKGLIKIGYFPTLLDFAGLFAGGNPILTSGTSTLIPVELGLTIDPSTAPAAEIALEGNSGLYVKGAVQRSADPRGLVTDSTQNAVGLRFTAERAGPLGVAEVGLKQDAEHGQHKLWLRAGGIYNASEYQLLGPTVGGRQYTNNYGFYALGDYQISQDDPVLPFRGLYAGISVQYANPQASFITQNYEGRVYYVGPFDSRPTDAINFTVNYNKYSKYGLESLSVAGLRTVPDQLQISLNYTAHLSPGLYAVPSITYTDHPSPERRYEAALNFGCAFYFLY